MNAIPGAFAAKHSVGPTASTVNQNAISGCSVDELLILQSSFARVAGCFSEISNLRGEEQFGLSEPPADVESVRQNVTGVVGDAPGRQTLRVVERNSHLDNTVTMIAGVHCSRDGTELRQNMYVVLYIRLIVVFQCDISLKFETHVCSVLSVCSVIFLLRIFKSGHLKYNVSQ